MSLQASGRFDAGFLGHVHAVVSLINALAVIAPIVAVLAACSSVAPPGQGQRLDVHYVATRMRHLREVLNAGSALLVTGILHMDAWLRWPASLVSDRDVQEPILGVALAITLFWGATFTLMLIATYAPATTYLGVQARKLLEDDVVFRTTHNPEQWLKDNGLFITLGEQLPQIGVMLAPLLAGPLGSLLMAPMTPSGQ